MSAVPKGVCVYNMTEYKVSTQFKLWKQEVVFPNTLNKNHLLSWIIHITKCSILQHPALDVCMTYISIFNFLNCAWLKTEWSPAVKLQQWKLCEALSLECMYSDGWLGLHFNRSYWKASKSVTFVGKTSHGRVSQLNTPSSFNVYSALRFKVIGF